MPKYTLDKVSKITGLKKADIKKLALEYGSTKKTYIRPNYGLNRHRNGGMMVRSIMLLPAITGAWKNKSSGCFVGSIEEMWNVDLGKLQRPDLLGDKKPRSIIYVSCDPASLARDTKILINNSYKLENLIGIDLFPMTHHIECIASYIKEEKKQKYY